MEKVPRDAKVLMTKRIQIIMPVSLERGLVKNVETNKFKVIN